MLLYLLVLTVLTSAKEHYDLDGDGRVAIDELAVVAYAEKGVSKGELGIIVKEEDEDGNGILKEEELRRAIERLEMIGQEKAKEWMKDNDNDTNARLNRNEFMNGVGKKVSGGGWTPEHNASDHPVEKGQDDIEVGLSRREINEIWRMADRDRNGMISNEECAEALYLIRTKAIMEGNKMLERYDSDKNGRLSEDEAILMADIVFDVGTDDALDSFERVARNEEEIGSSQMEGLLESLRETALEQDVDINGDGMVNFDELRLRFKKKKPSLLKKIFKKVDVNKDSALNGQEWVTLVGEMSKIKKRKMKNERVIHVMPSLKEKFQGAARDDLIEVRRKREQSGGEEIRVNVNQWDGILPTGESSNHQMSIHPDQSFSHFDNLQVLTDEVQSL